MISPCSGHILANTNFSGGASVLEQYTPGYDHGEHIKGSFCEGPFSILDSIMEIDSE